MKRVDIGRLRRLHALREINDRDARARVLTAQAAVKRSHEVLADAGALHEAARAQTSRRLAGHCDADVVDILWMLREAQWDHHDEVAAGRKHLLAGAHVSLARRDLATKREDHERTHAAAEATAHMLDHHRREAGRRAERREEEDLSESAMMIAWHEKQGT